MPDSEKLVALKKAYADIILNTAKEAAARIMVSERKAMRYQRELFAAKEDALCMLLRLKQMLDAKINETQVASLCQQRKIEELEAQLGEAEDIVKDLRTELREAQDDLERATNNQKQLLGEINSNGDVATLMTVSVENRLNTFETVLPSLPDTQSEQVMTSKMRNSTLNGTCESNKCRKESVSHKDSCYFCNSDFASIVMRRKGPKLYRNGCTQRIHAFERSLLEGNLSVSGQVEDVKNETCTGEDEQDLCINLDSGADKTCGVENNANEFKIMQANSNFIQVHPFKSVCRKRKRVARYKKSRASSTRNFPNQVLETTQMSDISSRTLVNGVDNNVQHKEESNEAEKNPESPLTLNLPSDGSQMILQSGCGEVIRSDIDQKTTNIDNLLLDKLELTRQESGPEESTEALNCKTDLEGVNMSAVNSHVKPSNLTPGITTQSLNDKFLKYTFQRKRKKEFLSSPDGYSSFEEGIMKRKMLENLNGYAESQNSSLITKSSRDTRSLEQVALQLVSLSEKKQR